MSERSCPVSGSGTGQCPVGTSGTRSSSRMGPRGCSFSGFTQPGDIHAAFDIPRGVDAEEWLRMRERKSINQLLYMNYPSAKEVDAVKSQTELDAMNANEHDLLAVALGAPARQVMLRAEEIGPKIGWADGYLSAEHGACPPDYDGRIWIDLADRMPGCVARGRVRESIAALPLIEGTKEVIPDAALWGAVVIYRYEDKYDGNNGVTANISKRTRPNCAMGDQLGMELAGIPLSVALPYFQVSRRLGRTLPHLSFPDQSSYNLRIRDISSTTPYLARSTNIDLRWSMFGEKAEIAFLKGCADTSASFQHGPDAIAACQEHVMNRNIEGLLREMVRLKEILERMPNAFHSISTNPNSGDNYVPSQQWVHWAQFSAPLSKRCPASSGLQFPPYLIMDAFLGRRKYTSFLGKEGVHLRAWLPSNLRAFIAAIEYHYRIPEFVDQSGDPRLMGVLDGIVEAYTGERGFMGVHRYKEIAGKTGRTETNGLSGAADASRPWEETHKQFSEAMKERLEPYRGTLAVEPHEMRGTFEECRYVTRVLNRSPVDNDHSRSIALVTLDIQDTGITFMPGDRLAVMPLNNWEECAKVAAALGLEEFINNSVGVTGTWARFENHLMSVKRSAAKNSITVTDILRRGHLAPITKELALKLHGMLHASSNTILQVLATNEWPVRGSLGDLLQAALMDTPERIWDKAFDLDDLSWLAELIPLEVPRTYSIASYTDELLPCTVDLAVSRAEYKVCATFAGHEDISRAGVSSGFLNPFPSSEVSPPNLSYDDEILVGVSRPAAFQLPIDTMAPCAFFAGGSGIAPFRSFWQSRLITSGLSGGKNHLYLGVQSREKFCFEEELREYVGAGFMEVHLAFSRDSRGLSYEPYSQDLVERHTPPRYIDTLITEQAATISELIMSKKQGGLGGYLFVCGSVSVFDSVMNGIRQAIYTHCTASMDNVDNIVNKAFAERRFMLDVFMTPKPLACNLPTIPLSQLALNTGHRPGTRTWVSVHGSVYDVTEFLPMHPGGTLIIKSNAGVDCSQSFDNLAHTNNPEVASLLTKYFVGPRRGNSRKITNAAPFHLPDLRSCVETLVAHQFEMYEIMGATRDFEAANSLNLWLREALPNTMAVRVFYSYQSRLLQGGFTALFGAKFQELVLKLSFGLAHASGPAGAQLQLPDILGTIMRVKTGPDAVACTRETALVGQFVIDAESSLRFQERGVFTYAAKAVQLDMELLEDLRQEVCKGMDAFDTIANNGSPMEAGLDGGGRDPDDEINEMIAMSSYLLQTLERMARRLGVYYAQLSQCSVYHPEIEKNPARTRWALVRRFMRDGSLFVLTSGARLIDSASSAENSYYVSRGNASQKVDFTTVMSQIQEMLGSDTARAAMSVTLNDVHHVRGRSTGGASAVATRDNRGALNAMSSFVQKNNKNIRRLSKMPTLDISAGGAFNLEEMKSQMGGLSSNQVLTPSEEPSSSPFEAMKSITNTRVHMGLTPPSSRGSSRSPTRVAANNSAPTSAEILISKLQHRRRSLPRPRNMTMQNRSNSPGSVQYYPVMSGSTRPPSPPSSHTFSYGHMHNSQLLHPQPQQMMLAKPNRINQAPDHGYHHTAKPLNTRRRTTHSTGSHHHAHAYSHTPSAPEVSGSTSLQRMRSTSSSSSLNIHSRNSSLRTLRLGGLMGERRPAPTF
ncbi:cytochrome b5-like Heme/Steroid binding domain-containing protein [Xylariaceae sp. FL1272]|nr:cytochrome b5-like Heme/Steroid binding domain-containing protein [Xylariaceae sp. FL1272]